MVFKIILLIIGLSILNPGLEAQDPTVPPQKPKLVIGIVISGMRFDYLDRYWNKFSEGGFKRLVNNGVFCKNAHHDYLIAESGAGYASISTGAYPDVHGIVSDYWYDRVRDKVAYSIDNEKVTTTGGGFGEGRFSPSKMLAGTLSDQSRISSQFKSKVFSISLDPRAAILSGGHSANAAYWFDNEFGKWITSSYYLDSLPQWVNEFNSKEFANLYLDKSWETMFPISEYTESISDINKYERGIGGKVNFPYDLKVLSSLKKNKKNFKILRDTPFGNTFTKDFAISTIVNENLGKGENTDWLQVSFASTSFIGKNFHTWSVEMEDAYIRLDKDLEHFLNFIDEEVKMKNVLIYLTSENAMADNPSFLKDNGMPSGYFNYNNAMFLLKTYLNLIYGNGEWVKFYYAQQIYLNNKLIEDSKLSIVEFQNRVANFMTQFEGVSNALTSTNMLTNNYTRGYFEKMQRSFSQKRSGDILLHLYPGWIEKGAETEFESSLNYDSHVPLILYGWKTGRKTIIRPISVTDLMPTIAVFLNITRPGSIEGKLMEELF